MTSLTASKITKSEQGMEISGALVFASVSDLLEQGNQQLKQHQDESTFVINCKAMDRIDSAGIALLIEWQRQCKDKNKTCRFEALPKQAKALIEAYKLQSFILV